MGGLKVTLFGGFDARLASGAGPSLPTKKAQALLAYLAVRPGQRHARDKLAALLWGDKSDGQARDRLRHAVLDLRRALDGPTPSAMRIEGQTLAMDPAAVEVDVAAFEGCVAQGTPQALEQAAELYRGDLLLGFSVNEPLFEEWLVAERERLREMALEALARLLAHQAEGASTERAIQTAVRLLALDPLQEAAHRALMRLYARQGRRGAALKQYQVCVGALQRELGTSPRRRRSSSIRTSCGDRGGSEDGRSGSEPSRSGRTLAADCTESPHRRDGAVRAAGGSGAPARAVGRGQARHGHVASVVGEAGIGKTRLVSTLVVDALGRGAGC
jgi:DNA-binding SARP family transcriptional activator